MNLRAYTIAEMLIVILVVIVCAALLMPVATGAKGKAHDVVCISNIRQIYAAMQLYRSDHGEYPPNSTAWPGLEGYLPAVLKCNSSKNPNTRMRANDYLLMGRPISIAMTDPLVVEEEFLRCRSLRGGDMPVIIDSNHTPLLLETKDAKSFFYIARESGAVKALPVKAALAAPKLCDHHTVSNRYNY